MITLQFEPFENMLFSCGVIYLVILNLPRELQFKWENIIIVGIILRPKEPNFPLNPLLTIFCFFGMMVCCLMKMVHKLFTNLHCVAYHLIFPQLANAVHLFHTTQPYVCTLLFILLFLSFVQNSFLSWLSYRFFLIFLMLIWNFFLQVAVNS